jgi:hypothetical protein
VAGVAGAADVGRRGYRLMHAEVLPPLQQSCLDRLGPAADRLGFYLAGGTAVALHLGHRRSVDFDWFTPAFPVAAVELADEFRREGVVLQPSSIADRTLHAVAQRGTKKDFIDVHALGARFGLGEMLGFYRRKFAIADVGRILAGLTYFDDAESDPMPSMLVPASWDIVKAELRDRVRRFASPGVE